MSNRASHPEMKEVKYVMSNSDGKPREITIPACYSKSDVFYMQDNDIFTSAGWRDGRANLSNNAGSVGVFRRRFGFTTAAMDSIIGGDSEAQK